MRTKNILLILNTVVFSILFYKQLIGLNIILFLLFILPSLLLLTKPKWRNTNTVLLLITTVITSLSCLYYGSLISVFTFTITLLTLVSNLYETKISLPTSLFISFFSTVFSFVLHSIEKTGSQNQEAKRKKFNPILALLIFIIILIFILIYSISNPLFGELIQKINFDFISIDWIIFTFIGFYLIYGLLIFLPNKEVSDWDLKKKTTLHLKQEKENSTFSQNDLLKYGIVLFALLNILILTVNATDFYYYLFHSKPTTEISYSAELHQSVGSLIFSIIMAITLILIYFNGNLNFRKNKKWLVIFAFIWIAQNVILALISVFKNYNYIQEYGLTHKRIGVYIYLILTVIGLFYTLLKIKNTKTNWFIFKQMYTVFFIFLVSYSTINWNSIILNHNIKYHKTIDWNYITTLSKNNIPQLLEIKKSDLIKNIYEKKRFNKYLKNEIDNYKEYQNKNWKSWNYMNYKIDKSINNEKE